MILKVKTTADVPSSEITPERFYASRREFMRTAGAGLLGAAFLAGGDAEAAQAPLNAKKSAFTVDLKTDPLNSWEQITTYNNYYEFGTDKSDPAQYAPKLTVKPWTVKVDGLVTKPGNYAVEDLVNFNELEERVYR